MPSTDVFGKTDTDEQHQPSLQKSAKMKFLNLLPVSSMPITLAFLSNVKYAPRKLLSTDKHKLSKCLEDHTFACGSKIILIMDNNGNEP